MGGVIEMEDEIKTDVLPHGTIICPNCGVAHSGLLDSIICDECDKPFWSLHVIERQIEWLTRQKVLDFGYQPKCTCGCYDAKKGEVEMLTPREIYDKHKEKVELVCAKDHCHSAIQGCLSGPEESIEICILYEWIIGFEARSKLAVEMLTR